MSKELELLRAIATNQIKLLSEVSKLKELFQYEMPLEDEDSKLIESLLSDVKHPSSNEEGIVRPKIINEKPKIVGEVSHRTRHGDGTVDFASFGTPQIPMA